MGGACLGTGKQGWTILDFGNGEEEAEKVSRVALVSFLQTWDQEGLPMQTGLGVSSRQRQMFLSL